MNDVRTKIETILNVKAPQKIQIVKIGRSDEPFLTFRRHLDNIKSL